MQCTFSWCIDVNFKGISFVIPHSKQENGYVFCRTGIRAGVQQKTAWKFKLKNKNARVHENQKKLEGNFQVDETIAGGYSEGNAGRSFGEKSAVLVPLRI